MNLSMRLLLLALLALLAAPPAVGRASGDASAECAALVSRSPLPGVSFVVEPACNVAHAAMDGCEPLTSCQLCHTDKTPLNAHFLSCAALGGWRQRARLQQRHESVALASPLDAESEAPAAAEDFSTAEVAAIVSLALGGIGGGAFIARRQRQRRRLQDEDEDASAIETPKDARCALVSVQSRTQIATL